MISNMTILKAEDLTLMSKKSKATLLKGLSKKQQNVISNFIDNLEIYKAPFEISEIITELPSAYGCFADINNDGISDYIATEMRHGGEYLSTHIKDSKNGSWEKVSQIKVRGHPLTPYVIHDDISKKSSILLPITWSPYYLLFPLTAKGRILPLSVKKLNSYLPKRISKSRGPLNLPFHITEIIHGKKGHPAFIKGYLDDVAEVGSHAIYKEWELTLKRKANSFFIKKKTPTPLEPFYTIESSELEEAYQRYSKLTKNNNGQPIDNLSRILVGYKTMDLDKDGLQDLIFISADFKTFIYYSDKLDINKKIKLNKEAVVSNRLSKDELLQLWCFENINKLFQYKNQIKKEYLAKNIYEAILIMDKIKKEKLPSHWLRLHHYNDPITPLLIHNMPKRLQVISFRKENKKLSPYLHFRKYHHPTSSLVASRWPSSVIGDFNNDTYIDILATDYLQPIIKDNRGFSYTFKNYLKYFFEYIPSKVKKKNKGPLSSFLLYQDGFTKEKVIGDILIKFPQEVHLPKNPLKGFPLTITIKIPNNNDKGASGITCIYFRPWNMGIFLTPKNRPYKTSSGMPSDVAEKMSKNLFEMVKGESTAVNSVSQEKIKEQFSKIMDLSVSEASVGLLKSEFKYFNVYATKSCLNTYSKSLKKMSELIQEHFLELCDNLDPRTINIILSDSIPRTNKIMTYLDIILKKRINRNESYRFERNYIIINVSRLTITDVKRHIAGGLGYMLANQVSTEDLPGPFCLGLSSTFENLLTGFPLIQPTYSTYKEMTLNYETSWSKELKKQARKRTLSSVRELLFTTKSDYTILKRMQLWGLVDMLSSQSREFFELLTNYNTKATFIKQVLTAYNITEKELNYNFKKYIRKLK